NGDLRLTRNRARRELARGGGGRGGGLAAAGEGKAEGTGAGGGGAGGRVPASRGRREGTDSGAPGRRRRLPFRSGPADPIRATGRNPANRAPPGSRGGQPQGVGFSSVSTENGRDELRETLRGGPDRGPHRRGRQAPRRGFPRSAS